MSTSNNFARLIEVLGIEPNEKVSICYRRPDDDDMIVTLGTAADAPARARPLAQTADVWFGVCPIRPDANLAPGCRGDASQMARIPAIWADLDAKPAPAGLGSTEACLAVVDRISALLDGAQPVAIVGSGTGGLHPYWRLDRYPDEDHERAARLLSRFGVMVQAVAHEYNKGHVDNVFDTPRILRVPGTQNHKPNGGAVTVSFTEDDGGEPDHLTLDDLEDALDRAGVRDIAPEQTGERVAASTWTLAPATCSYVNGMVTGWASDVPRAGRHQWLMGQAVRLAAACRRGCISTDGLKDAQKALESRFAAICATVGKPRKVGTVELSGAWVWAVRKVETMTQEGLRDELGGSLHDHEVDDQLGDYLNSTNGGVNTDTGEILNEEPQKARTTTTTVEKTRGQVRMAFRLAAAYRDQLLFVHSIGWFAWDGTRWIEDQHGAAIRAVLDVLQAAWQEALGDKILRKDVLSCQSAAGVKGVLAIASALPEFAYTVRDLDPDPYLINVANGTLDLRTMTLQPHTPSNRITKITRGAYDAQVVGHAWKAFLERVLPDSDVRGFLQRYVGLGLCGRVLEHKLAIWTGTGRNGKGVAYGAVNHALGDYAATAEPDLFMHREGAHPTGEYDLLGRRWVVVSETDRNRRLAEATMKRLTGGDIIRARRMRQDFIEFVPSHTAALITNHLPKVSGDDPALWARLTVIPFQVTIPEAEQNPHLGEQLQLEADAVLRWAVDGWIEYQQRGLDAPEAVLVATRNYRTDSDTIARFLADRTQTNKYGHVEFSELFEAFRAWAADDGAEPIGRRDFGKALDQRGFTSARTNGRTIRRGLILFTQEDDDAANS